MMLPDLTSPASRPSHALHPVFVRLLSVFLLSLVLSGCSFFDDTYLVESDYPLPDRKESSSRDTVTVTGLSDLRDAIRNTVAAGASERTIVFDSSYAGNPYEDLASACWQVRTEDALCAYCVENIAYEMTQIVSRCPSKRLSRCPMRPTWTIGLPRRSARGDRGWPFSSIAPS